MSSERDHDPQGREGMSEQEGVRPRQEAGRATPGRSRRGGAGPHGSGGRGVRDQIRRYRSAVLFLIGMIVVGIAIGGYVLSQERLSLPSWVPVIGHEHYVLKAEFQSTQAVTPGQGQSVTIAGAKVGEISNVDLRNGVAVVTMQLVPRYARIYRDATMLLRPKTQLKDMTVEVDPGKPSSGHLPSGSTLSLSQTAPDIDFDEFLAALDAETREYLQELLAAGSEGLHHNGRRLSAVFKRFDPTARLLAKLSKPLEKRQRYIAESIHDFQQIVTAIGGKDKQLTEVISASNTVFETFAQQDAAVEKTLKLLPGALDKTKQGLGKLARASSVLGPTLHKLIPFATSLGPALKDTRPFLEQTAPIFKSEIRPFAREVLPVVNKIAPSTEKLSQASPDLTTSFSVLNEFFNELAYNPGSKQGGFLFFLDWANHNVDSVLSSSDASGTLGNTLVYFNCTVLPILRAAGEVNPTVRLLVGLLNLPSRASCPTSEGGTAPDPTATTPSPAATKTPSPATTTSPTTTTTPSPATKAGGKG